MCELFAMSSRVPANVQASFGEFSRHGGLAGSHKDGWGIAWYVDEDVRLLKEPEPASDSACVRFLQEHPFASSMVVSHIRTATRGRTAVENCQPFVRELGGRQHVFAHNGDLDTNRLAKRFPLANFHPVGDTDSEYAFCALLERLRGSSLQAESRPSLDERMHIVADFAAELRAFGPANFVYSDGDALFLHAHKRRHAGGAVKPPGLYVLRRRCPGKVGSPASNALAVEQELVIAASVPLTTEAGWQALDEGELLVAQHGRLVARPSPSRVRSAPGGSRIPDALLHR